MNHEQQAESEGRVRILQAAFPLFVQQGYKAVSMQQVADAASVNKATLYHHFRNKDALFLAVVQIAMGSAREQIGEVIQDGGPIRDQLERIASMMFNNNQSELGRLMTDVHEFLPMDARLTIMKDTAAPWDLYDQVFSSAVSSGELPEIDVSLATSMFIGLIHGQIWARKIGRLDTPLQDSVARSIVGVLVAGLQNATPS